MTKLVFAVLMLSGGDVWVTKPPEEWNDKDARKVVTASPWAKTVTATTSGHAPTDPANRTQGARRGGMMGGMGGRGGMGSNRNGTGAPPLQTRVPVPDAKGIVRWESAQPVREAERRLESETPLAEGYVVVSLTLLGQEGETAAHQVPKTEQQRSSFAKYIRDAVTIEAKGESPVKPEKAEVKDTPEGPMIVFYFPRSETPSGEEHEVTFTAKMYPLQFQAKFKTKDMKYGGKVEM